MIRCGTTTLPINICGCHFCVVRRHAEMQASALMQTLAHIPLSQRLPRPMAPPPSPQKKLMKDEIDLEVGRHALRTFKCENNNGLPTLTSLYQPTTWDGGVMIAECKKKDGPCAEPPGDNCMCGVYGTLTLEHLVGQYRSYARNCIGVIAAEGKTIIGDRGLRTAAARLVAYWCSPLYEENFAASAPDAKRFTKIEDMLGEYDFPESPIFEDRAAKVEEYVRRTRHLERSTGWATQLSDADLRKAWESISDQTKAATTPGGIAALKHILGFT